MPTHTGISDSYRLKPPQCSTHDAYKQGQGDNFGYFREPSGPSSGCEHPLSPLYRQAAYIPNVAHLPVRPPLPKDSPSPLARAKNWPWMLRTGLLLLSLYPFATDLPAPSGKPSLWLRHSPCFDRGGQEERRIVMQTLLFWCDFSLAADDGELWPHHCWSVPHSSLWGASKMGSETPFGTPPQANTLPRAGIVWVPLGFAADDQATITRASPPWQGGNPSKRGTTKFNAITAVVDIEKLRALMVKREYRPLKGGAFSTVRRAQSTSDFLIALVFRPDSNHKTLRARKPVHYTTCTYTCLLQREKVDAELYQQCCYSR